LSSEHRSGVNARGGLISPEAFMRTRNRQLDQLSQTLIWRGGLMVALGVGAIAMPETLLIVAMVTIGVVATAFGVYEMGIAFSGRHVTTWWWAVLLHGMALLGFAVLTVGAPALSLRITVAGIAAWLLGYAAIMWSVAVVVWTTYHARVALVVWGLLHVGLAIAAVMYPEATIFALLYVGAWYAVLFGTWQLVAGLWMRRVGRAPRASGHEESLIAAHH
jgi:uncharacterized membrane protein HdeD (DUF308 family)